MHEDKARKTSQKINGMKNKRLRSTNTCIAGCEVVGGNEKPELIVITTLG